MESENYLLTRQEFVLLAATVGITRLRGFDMNIEEIERDRAVLALQELTQRGLLENGGERFRIVGEIGDIFSVIRDADTTLEVHKKTGKTCLFYLAESAVKVTLSARRQGVYEVKRMEVDEVWRHMTEEGWIRERQPLNGEVLNPEQGSETVKVPESGESGSFGIE